MSKFSQLIESISSKDVLESDKLFESILAEKISEGLTARENLIQEQVMEANPDLFQSPVDQKAAMDHAPVEADHSVRTDEIEVPAPVEIDGSREADPEEEEQDEMNEGYVQHVFESHDFEADEDEQDEHPENVAKVPVGASAEHNQATQNMKPSQASAEQIEEDTSVCEECGGDILGEEEHVCEAHDDLEEELSPKQKKIDLNKNGKVDGSDLAKLRKEEEGTDEPGKLKGNDLEEGKGPDKGSRVRRSPYTAGDKAARVGGNVAGALAGYGAGTKAGEALGLNPIASKAMGAATGLAAGAVTGTAARQTNRKLRGAKE